MPQRILAAVQRELGKGVAALVWGGIVAVLAFVGVGLLLAAVQIGLARAIGPILAAAVLGVTLIVVAVILGLMLRLRKADPAQLQPPVAPPPEAGAGPSVPEALFVLGFVAARSLLRRYAP